MGATDHLQPPTGVGWGSDHSGDALEVIEVASAVLVRNFELLRRRDGVQAGLDRAEYLLLRTLDATGPADICTLAAALGLDPSTAGRQVAVMAGKGLVERAPAATDRRRSIISPTADGLDRMSAARTMRQNSTAELLADWTEEDLGKLAEMFTRYNRAVAEHYLGDLRPESAQPTVAAVEALLPHATVGH
ncbi:MAG TPA: MarR family winged helix-turn-helix transcriptional regulator [Pseudonocardiaceae bacterium]|jgi:DNA-binding MarR family transcriptional regulator|nr:MarR family winged helix-turn-helix transcriptional regulator [Pseudonocardiaceae bacterium]